MSNAKHDRLKQDLDELKLNYITEHYRELLDDAARKNTSALDILIQLIGGQAAARREALRPHVRERDRRVGAIEPWPAACAMPDYPN